MKTTSPETSAEPIDANDEWIAFEVVAGKPTPIFPIAGSKVNGETIIGLRDCVARFGGTETSRRLEWQAIWGRYVENREAGEADSSSFMFKLIDGVPMPHKFTEGDAVDGVTFIDAAYAAAKFGGTESEWKDKWGRMISHMAQTLKDAPAPSIRETVDECSELAAETGVNVHLPLRIVQAIDFWQRAKRLHHEFSQRPRADGDDGVIETHILFTFQQLERLFGDWMEHAVRVAPFMLGESKVVG